MVSLSFPVFEQKFKNLRTYIEVTANMRGIVLSQPSMSEPTILDSDLIALQAALPDSVRWRVMEHTLAVGHLYALYESYCEDILSDWISFQADHLSFTDLSPNLIKSYQIGFSRISSILPSPRYVTLTISNVVKNYHDALEGRDGYKLDAECLTYHKNNLRWSDVSEIFFNCGISDISAWISSCESLKKYFEDSPQNISEQVSSKLSDLVQYRNDCSHGVVDVSEILGHDDLMDFIEFIELICKSFDQLILWKKIEILKGKGQMHEAGKVSEVFKSASAFVCKSEKISYEVGQKIYIRKGAKVVIDEIISIRINDENVAHFEASSGDELGMKCKLLPAKGSNIYITNLAQN